MPASCHTEASWRRSLERRLLRSVAVTALDRCWMFTGAKTPKGYGVVWTGREGRPRHNYAHRLMFERLRGRVPHGLCVLHACDTPACCNPLHLWLGTVGANNRDMAQKGRHWMQRRTA